MKKFKDVINKQKDLEKQLEQTLTGRGRFYTADIFRNRIFELGSAESYELLQRIGKVHDIFTKWKFRMGADLHEELLYYSSGEERHITEPMYESAIKVIIAGNIRKISHEELYQINRRLYSTSNDKAVTFFYWLDHTASRMFV